MPSTGSHGPALITGGEGFVAGYLARNLTAAGVRAYAPGRANLDLLDRHAVRARMEEIAPDRVFHLAAFSSPMRSLERPGEVVIANLAMTVNLLDAMREAAPAAAVVLASSGQVYGAGTGEPLTEESPLAPANPYAVSKVACDLLGAQYASCYDLRVVRLRPFNHAGPGQSAEYVVSSLARQVAQAEAERRECVLRTGNVHTKRDFTDVRDIARAYVAAADLRSGVFNASSNSLVSVGEMVERLQELALVSVQHEIDPARVRHGEAEQVHGSSERLRVATGWRPKIDFSETLRATLDWWRERVR